MNKPSLWSDGRPRVLRILFLLALLCGLFCLVFSQFVLALRAYDIGVRSKLLGSDVFFYFLTEYEPRQLIAIGLAFFLLGGALLRGAQWSWNLRLRPWSMRVAAGFSVGIFVLVAVLRSVAYLDYDVCIDESLPHFQSEAFLRGDLRGHIPSEWMPLASSAVLSFVAVNWATGDWGPGFLPLHSLVRTPAAWLGLDGYMNAVLLGINLFAFYILVRRIWPHHPSRATWGCLFFAFFPQVIITCLSSFAMEAHALALTLWLLCYVARKRSVFLLTPWVGILAMGVHQPHIHLILAAPFVARLLWQKRFMEFLYFSAVYIIGAVFWLSFLALIRPNVASSGPLFQFGFSPVLQLVVEPANLGLMMTWSTPVMTLLLLGGICTAWFRSAFILDALLATLLLFGFYISWPFTEGHGWGYRFIYPAIPLLLLLALHALSLVRWAAGPRGVGVIVLVSLAFTIIYQLPSRCAQAHAFVATHRNVYQVIVSTPGRAVLVDDRTIWYGGDFIRNPPFLDQKPVIFSSSLMNPRQFLLLLDKEPALRMVTLDELKSTGHPAAWVREQD